MIERFRVFAIAVIVICAPLQMMTPAMARRHSGSHSSYCCRTSYCKSTSCMHKHPDGKYIHPLTPRKHHHG